MVKENILNYFASYNTIFTLSCLTRDELAMPNETYKNNIPANVILRSGGGATNKVNTIYEDLIGGKLEYFIDNLAIKSLVAPNNKSRVANANYFEFTIYEPYSMGLFMQTLQIAATNSGYRNYIASPFMLSVEFVGYDDDGDVLVTENGENIRRDFPIKITNIEFEVDQGGCTYSVEAMPWNEQAFSDQVQGIGSDIQIKGKTTIQLLQNGEQSLTTILNGRLEELKQQDQLLEADEIVITFPADIDTKTNAAQTSSNTNTGATRRKSKSGGIFGQIAAGAIGGVIGGALSGNKNIGQNALQGALGGALGGFGGGLLGGLGQGLGGLLTQFKSGDINGLFQNISGFLGAQAPQNFEAFLSMITGQVLTKSNIGQNLARIAQSEGSANSIGASKIVEDFTEQGQAPMAQTGQVYDAKNKVMTRAKNVISNDERMFSWPAGTKITRMIEEVVLTTAWAKELRQRSPDANGMVPWFRIDAETYLKPNVNQETVYGTDAKVYHYKVTEYMVHTSHFQKPNDPGPSYVQLKNNAVKEYNYIYTGKNIDILNFNIRFNASFFQYVQSDVNNGSNDFKQGGTQNRAVKQPVQTLSLDTNPAGSISASGATVQMFTNSTSTMGNGGSGIDNSAIRWARQFHDQILGSGSVDLVEVDLEIHGDPYYMFDSGLGNWTDTAASLNETSSGQIEYQRSECDVILNFRTPIDYDNELGNMIFPEDTVPVGAFSGLYKVIEIENIVRQNQFTQRLKLLRRRNQPEDLGVDGAANSNKVVEAQTSQKMPSPYKDI